MMFVGAASGERIVDTSAISIEDGDLILGLSYRDSSNTPPTLATGVQWTNVSFYGVNTNSYRLGMKVAPTNTTSGVWSGATSTIVAVYRPTPGYVLSVGAVSHNGGLGTAINYPALAPTATDINPWIVGFAGHRLPNESIVTPPAGMINRHVIVDGVDSAVLHDTNSGVSGWSDQAVEIGGSALGWIGVTIELHQTFVGLPDNRRVRMSYWM